MKTWGYNGAIARINLTDRTVSVENPEWQFYRTYIGGRSIIAYYLLNELKPDCEPLSPDNKMVFAASVITGASLPGFARHSVGAKSPLTGLFGESEAGGYWGPELKGAGYDALIVEGKADAPVYLWIHDGEIEICDASDMWGCDTGKTFEKLKEDTGEKKVRFLGIGQAGEIQVRYAGICSELYHYHGRTGLGAVMGSKNLKAVAVRGKNKPDVHDKEKVKELFRWFSTHYMENVDNASLHEYGTSAYYYNAQQAGLLPTKNFNTTMFKVDTDVDVTHKKYKVKREGCFACPVQCKQSFKSESSEYGVDPKFGGPEFETLGAFNSICLVDEPIAAAKAHELCNAYGLDTITCGMTIGWAMECFERGLLTKEDTGGLDVSFGNAEVMLKLIDMIAVKEGFGKLLAEGSKKAAEIIGRGTEEFVMGTKGMEFPMAEPRVKYGLGLAYLVSPTGADHLQHEHDGAFDPDLTGYSHNPDDPYGMVKHLFPFGILSPVPALSIGWEKVRLFTYLQHYWSMFNTIGTCIFTFAPVRSWSVMQMVDIVKAVTGWETSIWELMKIGQRGTTMARAFNLKHGLKPGTDKLPKRMYEPLPDGPMKGQAIDEKEMDDAQKLYYGMMGWDEETGIPTRSTLYELNLPWLVEDMAKI